ncbi:hypothetical protein T07_7840 [Trichinella nelsoni]|uniref:Uncharacterized protein n=1 Tax=Trichinella nelsoni TaxID=6336 RepID=A0A0V0SJ16_9BILA|nr:hypothetical protein T07_7840 [Trichinella nelsoni]
MKVYWLTRVGFSLTRFPFLAMQTPRPDGNVLPRSEAALRSPAMLLVPQATDLTLPATRPSAFCRDPTSSSQVGLRLGGPECWQQNRVACELVDRKFFTSAESQINKDCLTAI